MRVSESESERVRERERGIGDDTLAGDLCVLVDDNVSLAMLCNCSSCVERMLPLLSSPCTKCACALSSD